jgi:hypothetical protein
MEQELRKGDGAWRRAVGAVSTPGGGSRAFINISKRCESASLDLKLLMQDTVGQRPNTFPCPGGMFGVPEVIAFRTFFVRKSTSNVLGSDAILVFDSD